MDFEYRFLWVLSSLVDWLEEDVPSAFISWVQNDGLLRLMFDLKWGSK